VLSSFLAPAVAALLVPADTTLDAGALSGRIDAHLAARQARDGVRAAPPADDPEFFRRLCLDLIGRIPTVAELKDFLDDDRHDKRARWADELLGGPDYSGLCAANFATHWRKLLLARAGASARAFAPKLEGWLARNFRENTPYDRLVRGLLAGPDGQAFYRAHDNKPADIAGSTARLFLGVKLECAQCHDDRTGAPWKRTQFWEYAAFFGGPGEKGDGPPARIQIPDTKTWVEGHFLDGARPAARPGIPPRALLAQWMTRPDNPWFARAAVNRLWHYFFGTGLIDPVDGLGSADASCSHPELLDQLTRQFIAHHFDQKYLIRALVGSRAYQRTSRPSHDSQKDPRHFARAAVRGLRPEQVYQSLLTATGFRPELASTPPGPDRGFGRPSIAGQFLAHFNDPHEEPIAAQTSIQQALFLMNDRLMDDATSLRGSRVLAAVAKAGGKRSTAQQVEELYLAVLSRPPRPEESERLVRYVETGGAVRGRTAALCDVFWALLNSPEFALQH
jgi:hypothetical protein